MSLAFRLSDVTGVSSAETTTRDVRVSYESLERREMRHERRGPLCASRVVLVGRNHATQAGEGRHREQSFRIHLLLLRLSFGQLIERSLAQPPPQPMSVTEQVEAFLNLQTNPSGL